MSRAVFSLIIAIFLISGGFASAQIITSTNFKIDRQELLSSGHRVTSSGFVIEGNLGQPVVSGDLTSDSFRLGSGILVLPAAVVESVEEAVEEITAANPGGGSLIRNYIREFIEREIPGFVVPSDYDLNNDGYINLIDLSVFLYLAELPPKENPADFNKDLVIDLADLSILFFQWAPDIVDVINDLSETSAVESDEIVGFGQASLIGGSGLVAGSPVEKTPSVSATTGEEATSGGTGILNFIFGIIKFIVKFIIGIFGG
ncbi:MAG: hypothetical protein HYT03_01940 [Candidatus Harrisonbacteria bacterium]|nr:hypothetical protein [Candidatus Harrisonbacteria bacterium]